MNVLNKDERFYLFLLEICKRGRTRQSAFYGFYNTDLFFVCLFCKDRWLPVPLLFPLPLPPPPQTY